MNALDRHRQNLAAMDGDFGFDPRALYHDDATPAARDDASAIVRDCLTALWLLAISLLIFWSMIRGN